MKHPDHDTLRSMLNDVGRTVKVHAGKKGSKTGSAESRKEERDRRWTQIGADKKRKRDRGRSLGKSLGGELKIQDSRFKTQDLRFGI